MKTHLTLFNHMINELSSDTWLVRPCAVARKHFTTKAQRHEGKQKEKKELNHGEHGEKKKKHRICSERRVQNGKRILDSPRAIFKRSDGRKLHFRRREKSNFRMFPSR